MLQYLVALIATGILGYTVNSSVKVIAQGDEALVERLGKYKRTLKPGLQFVLPLVDKIAHVDTVRERFLDIPPQEVLTNDGLNLQVDAIVYWQILEMERAYYAIENVESSINEIVLTSLRSEIGRLPMQEILSSIDEINKALLKKLDEDTSSWGVKVIRVEIQNITYSETVKVGIESERVALSEQKAAIAKAEGEKQAALLKAKGQAESIQLLATSLNLRPDSPEFMKFLVAQRYLETNQKLSESTNSKVLFVDPRTMSEGLSELMGESPEFSEIELKKAD
ncbi:MAG: paraslipin [Okeania sp. SIO3I5]|uniref:SPFH domain-containing protein n=1 Tax=Okeania sp. SIO3I5 TaxID=2607805 RepID=UPI0013B991F7|nr:stomatin-like protein [Okeania sp. SIO3I5]NEQ41331.1 paraslipin [Okeania sp. SIO3I5]